MPNRIIKDSICTSDNLSNLSAEAEVLFYHLIVNCDDFGRMDARPQIVKTKCFPLKSDVINSEQVLSWLSELQANALITIYSINGKSFLYFNTWENHQQKRAKYSKYPDPNGSNPTPNIQTIDSNSNQLIANERLYESESESENVYESESDKDEEEMFSDFVKVYEETVGEIINQTNAEDIKEFSKEYPLSWFKRVCEITKERKPKYSKVQYIRKILKDWEENGFENKTTNNNKPPEPTRKYRELKPDDPELLDYIKRQNALKEKNKVNDNG